MLTWFRDKAKIFLIATIVIFVALIFFNWGMDSGSTAPSNPYERAVARVAGSDVFPDEYNRSIQDLTDQYRQTLESSGNPDAESMLMLMNDMLAEEAFTGLVDSRLEEVYLKGLGWNPVSVAQAEAMLEAQVSMQDLGGMTPEEYIQQIMDQQPGLYEQYLYQTFTSAQSLRFPLSASMLSMSSNAEVDFLLLDSQGQISARYVLFDSIPPAPDGQAMQDFYSMNPELFVRPDGSLIRYVTVQVLPAPEDVQYAMEVVDSLSFATSGRVLAATREQLIANFGQDSMLQLGQRSLPFIGDYSANPAIRGCHVLLLDSMAAYVGEPTDSLLSSGGLDTLYLQSWEVPVLPGTVTVRNLLWRVEDQMDSLLATDVPMVHDSLLLAGFGNMMVCDDSPLLGILTEELVTFADDTIWPDSIGPVFFSPSLNGGYPAFTVVRRLEYYPADSMSMEEALNSGYLQETAMSHARLDASRIAAEAAMQRMTSSGTNLGTWADAESALVYSTQAFTASSVRANAYGDPNATSGLLSSLDFALAALTAPEFQVIGPFRTGNGYAVAEIVSRQAPASNPSMSSMMHAVAQRGADILSMQHIILELRTRNEIEDLRDEWQEYMSAVEDSIRAEEDSLGN
jgi:hypothetical protein